ncbi:MAG: hypothetical protein HLUCCO17_09910 [Saliniramus fredricksonii]|uniref:Uncharacterized protein n=1 Tax=Saliniramus fredricksonii TaxID=1653334 RepID=A0A0P8BMC1_9HYPH|nr:hypothetical protein [Saliniramus fredricksonii]KPQ10760.1 MAG: hypothetical protein HLUCCO17_09910 [Saliniramus fredricksonii]SCC79536.1 hypothetical protein GA0071312_0957 [Saliniramus fredricksonii]
MSLAPISRSLTGAALCAAALLSLAVVPLAVVATPATAETSRITVLTGAQANQSELAGTRSDQTIRIVIADPVRPGIRRPPVAEPVLYVIEDDEAVRAVR